MLFRDSLEKNDEPPEHGQCQKGTMAEEKGEWALRNMGRLTRGGFYSMGWHPDTSETRPEVPNAERPPKMVSTIPKEPAENSGNTETESSRWASLD